MIFGWVTSGSAWIGLLTLTILQVVLGVDNIVLLTILAGGLPKDERERARKLGVIVAMLSRLILLGVISWLSHAEKPFGTVMGVPVSIKSLILGIGGLFLIWKATQEMYLEVEHHSTAQPHAKAAKTLRSVLSQIFVLDVVFSIDQVVTAVGLAKDVAVQVISVLLSVAAMLVFVNKLAKFLDHHPSIRLLALSFLVLIGMALVGESTGFSIPKGYIYFAMAYAVSVEWLNIRRRTKLASTEARLHPAEQIDSGP